MLKANLERLKGDLEGVTKERDGLKKKVGELETKNADLQEKVAFYLASTDFERRDGLLYDKKDNSGPYCPVDLLHMTKQGHSGHSAIWKCPKCGHEAKAHDPAFDRAIDSYGFVRRPGGGYQFEKGRSKGRSLQWVDDQLGRDAARTTAPSALGKAALDHDFSRRSVPGPRSSPGCRRGARTWWSPGTGPEPR